MPVEVERLFLGDPAPCGGTVEDRLESGLVGHRCFTFRRCVKVRTDPAYARGLTGRGSGLGAHGLGLTGCG
ncbi:hypothetical protein GCM10010347_11340 [Streptomyces cirratus]|uniref:Uncharacterized protein n=1 Tax=Streptomyces cirratus TaxID=68187 RepID=A0ABQ3EM24_9ACTN|nr:hypothetical protein GCM10010347_11340 [Streptomyces cirratus]